MQTTITTTQQWQIYIPEAVRQALGLNMPKNFIAQVHNKKLILTPTDSPILKLAGKYKSVQEKKKIDVDSIRDQINYSEL